MFIFLKKIFDKKDKARREKVYKGKLHVCSRKLFSEREHIDSRFECVCDCGNVVARSLKELDIPLFQQCNACKEKEEKE